MLILSLLSLTLNEMRALANMPFYCVYTYTCSLKIALRVALQMRHKILVSFIMQIETIRSELLFLFYFILMKKNSWKCKAIAISYFL